MEQAGATVIAPANHIGAVGFSEGLAMAPSAVGVFLAAVRHCRTRRPDVAVLIANDVFNVLLGRRLRAKGIPTVALFPPQAWIWKSVARVIAPSFDLVLASFPDEAQCYRQAGVPVEFVGHYLADVLGPATAGDRAAARASLSLAPAAPVVAVLPGSRQREIKALLPIMLEAVDVIRHNDTTAHALAAMSQADAATGVDTIRTPGGHCVRLCSNSHMAMSAADVAVVCSGTATLEAALIGVPMVVAYKASWITQQVVRAWIRAGLIRDETIALPNLLLGRPIVPELIQRHVTAPALAEAVLPLLSDGAPRRAMQAALREVRAQVEQPDTLARVARIVLERAGC